MKKNMKVKNMTYKKMIWNFGNYIESWIEPIKNNWNYKLIFIIDKNIIHKKDIHTLAILRMSASLKAIFWSTRHSKFLFDDSKFFKELKIQKTINYKIIKLLISNHWKF